MEDLLAQIEVASDPQAVKRVLDSPSVRDLLRAERHEALAVALALDPTKQGLAMLYLLEAAGGVPSMSARADFLEATLKLLRSANSEELFLSLPQVMSLSRQLKTAAMARARELHALGALRRLGLLLIHDNCPTLTPLHVDVIQLAIITKRYHVAEPFIEPPACLIKQRQVPCTLLDVLLYCYYGGILQLTRRRYEDALWLFQAVITLPVTAVSAVALAAAKKWILLTVLHRGVLPVLPKSIPGIVGRAIRSECGPYWDAAKKLTASPTPSNLPRELSSCATAARQDGNKGLLDLAVRAVPQHALSRLSRVYCRLPLQRCADLVGLGQADTETLILRMVEERRIAAMIDHAIQTVSFGITTLESFDNGEAMRLVEEMLEKCADASELVSELDREIRLDPMYIASQGLTAADVAAAQTAAQPSSGLERVSTATEPLADVPAWQEDDENMEAIDATPPGIRERPQADGTPT